MTSHDATESAVTVPLAELPPGGSTTVRAFGTTVAVFNVAGELFAVGNNCPHQGAPLCHGRVSGTHLPSRPQEYRYGREGQILTCPWHGWQYDLESGRAVFDASVRAKAYETRLEDGRVVLIRRRRADKERPVAAPEGHKPSAEARELQGIAHRSADGPPEKLSREGRGGMGGSR